MNTQEDLSSSKVGVHWEDAAGPGLSGWEAEERLAGGRSHGKDTRVICGTWA